MSSVSVPVNRRPPARLGAPTPRALLVILAAIALGIVLYLGRSALTPFLVGALLIYILDPVVGFVARLRIGRFQIPRGLAVLIVYLLTVLIVVEAVYLLLVPLISELIRFVGDLPSLVGALQGALASVAEFYGRLELPPAIRDYVDSILRQLGEGGPSFDPGALLPIARSILGTVAGFLGFLIIPVWAFYLLRDRVRLTEQAHDALPAAWREDTWAVVGIVNRVVRLWIRAQILLGVLIGGATYLGLLLLGNLVDERFLQFAIFLAVIAGLLELLPIIGPILAMIPTLLVALTTQDPLVSIIAVVALYTTVQQVENAILVPKIQGEALELHPSVIIFVLILGGAIAGLTGAILSIPITAAAVNVYRYLFRRLSTDDPSVPPADAPDMLAVLDEQPDDGTAGQPDRTDRPISSQAQTADDVADVTQQRETEE